MVKLELFGTVGNEITVESVRAFLNANKHNDIQFEIATLGGDLNTGLLIHDLIKTHPKNTIGKIIGLTASAGTVIALGCDEVIISDNALFLIHNGWKEVTGNVYDMQKAAADLMKTDALMVKIYREKTGLPDAKIIDLMKASDWMSSYEALNFGFVDQVVQSGIKIAASAMVTQARSSNVNEVLIKKLEEKMNIFGKKKDKQVLNVLALKDNKQCLINAEEVAAGVEVAPLGAMSLEDGEYELADGRKIIVAGGVITEVVDPAASAAPAPETEAIVSAVSALVIDEIAKVKAEFMAELGKIKSTHVPPKGAGPKNPGQASATPPADVAGNIEKIQAGIFDAIQKSRKA